MLEPGFAHHALPALQHRLYQPAADCRREYSAPDCHRRGKGCADVARGGLPVCHQRAQRRGKRPFQRLRGFPALAGPGAGAGDLRRQRPARKDACEASCRLFRYAMPVHRSARRLQGHIRRACGVRRRCGARDYRLGMSAPYIGHHHRERTCG